MALMTIGDFSRATRLTAKALRLYHREGLLVPASVDEGNGYRLYAPEQVTEGQVVRELRALDVPLDAVREALAAPSLDARTAIVSAHLERLEARLEETRAAVETLRALLAEGPDAHAIEHRSVPGASVVGIREVIDIADLGPWFRGAVAELGTSDAGPFGGVWSTGLCLDGRGEAMVHLPAGHLGAPSPLHGRLRRVVLPAVDLAVATHRGPDRTVPHVYAALGRYVARHEIGVDAPVRETYLRGLPGLDDETVTEIGWPIFRISR